MAETQAGEGVEASGEVTPAAETPTQPQTEPDLVGDTLTYLARSLVSNVDDVRIEKVQTERGLVYRLHVNQEDMGRVIGAVMSQVKGRAEGGTVSRLVKESLGG